jgi:ketosteroid isomerase-like protein
VSQEDVEIVRRCVEAFRQRDAATLRSLWSRDGVFTAIFVAAEGRTYSLGLAGAAAAFLEDIDAEFEDWQPSEEEIIDVGGGRVVLEARISGTGRDSGINVDQRIALVFTLRNGKVARGETYLDPDEALEAARRRE